MKTKILGLLTLAILSDIMILHNIDGSFSTCKLLSVGCSIF